MGADVQVDADVSNVGEPIGTRVRHATVRWRDRDPRRTDVPGVIDELPVLGALATHGGELRVTGAQELRVKESDRISALADGLRRMGGDIEELPDGFHVRGRGVSAAAKWTHATIIGWRWRSRLRRSAPRVRRRFTTPGLRPCRIPSSFAVLESLRA